MSTLDSVFWSEDGGHRLVTGRVTSSPAAIEDGVMVKIPSFDEGVDEFGPCAFSPMPTDDGPLYPNEGDSCLVAFDERNAAWVLLFVPI